MSRPGGNWRRELRVRDLAAWLFLKVGDTLATARKWDEAQLVYGTAIEALKDRAEPRVVAKDLGGQGTGVQERQNDFPKSGRRIW